MIESPRPSTGRASLTRREREILERVAEGLTNVEIGTLLGLKTSTVKVHVHRVLKKLGVKGRAEAAANAGPLGGHRTCKGIFEWSPTHRQLEVLEWVARGRNNTEISQILEIPLATVKSRLHFFCVKTGARTRAHAVSMARWNDWLE